jgi:hypothetical protein
MDDFVMVPVPARRVQEVYELLAKPATPSAADRRGPWPPETLKRCYSESSDHFQKFLDTLADNAETPVAAADLAKATGLTYRNGVAGMLGAAGKRIDGRYHLSFPWARHWRASESQNYYTMSQEDAAVIRSLRTP